VVIQNRFEISPTSFFQTNPNCASELYSVVCDYVEAGLSGSGEEQDGAVLLDLFCGTGTIAQIMASRFSQQQPIAQHRGGVLVNRSTRVARIIGVELQHEAVQDARISARRNGLDHITEFIAADVGGFLRERPEFKGRIHTVIIDPPRAGITPKSLQRVMRLSPEQIVYVSCNPATQARDAKILSQDGGYNLKRFSIVDQFPHTSHVETVALFKK
jgi:23S rRNA (uracil1939-C5)-methyltransferase